jgi:hypothetical protein
LLVADFAFPETLDYSGGVSERKDCWLPSYELRSLFSDNLGDSLGLCLRLSPEGKDEPVARPSNEVSESITDEVLSDIPNYLGL